MVNLPRPVVGQLLAVLAAISFGLSGAFIKPLLASGWSPAAAVTVRVLIGGSVLLVPALISLRGRWDMVWANRYRILGVGAVGVAGAQLTYFAAVERIPVGTAILIELSAPLLLVLVGWLITRRLPAGVVLVGSGLAAIGLVMTVSGGGAGAPDLIGLLFALGALVACAAYFVVAALPNEGLPPVALAAFALLLSGVLLGLVGLLGLVPFTISTDDVFLFDTDLAWWVPMLVVGILATAVSYACSIAASELIGSRLASFLALLEVAAASVYAWLLLNESMTLPQLAGGLFILVGIAFVRADRREDPVSAAAAARWVKPAGRTEDPDVIGVGPNLG